MYLMVRSTNLFLAHVKVWELQGRDSSIRSDIGQIRSSLAQQVESLFLQDS